MSSKRECTSGNALRFQVFRCGAFESSDNRLSLITKLSTFNTQQIQIHYFQTGDSKYRKAHSMTRGLYSTGTNMGDDIVTYQKWDQN